MKREGSNTSHGKRPFFQMARLACGTLALVALATLGGAPASAQASVDEEISGIRAALDEIVTLLRVQARDQRAELLLRQLSIKSARLSPIESELRAART